MLFRSATLANFQALQLPPDLDGYMGMFKYDQVYNSPWAVSYQVEERHREISKKIPTATHDQEGKQDLILYILMFFVLALNPDFLSLHNRKLVEQLQLRYLNLIRNYLNLKWKQELAHSKLAIIMANLSLVREATDIEANKRLMLE